jgi:succinate dehydrogenase / fumarate reductase membrane anchor subunit
MAAMVKQSKLAVTGAHYGLRDWLVQRITAILMVLYLALMIVAILATGPYQDYAAWKNLFNQQWYDFHSIFHRLILACLDWPRNVLMDMHACSSSNVTDSAFPYYYG